MSSNVTIPAPAKGDPKPAQPKQPTGLGLPPARHKIRCTEKPLRTANEKNAEGCGAFSILKWKYVSLVIKIWPKFLVD